MEGKAQKNVSTVSSPFVLTSAGSTRFDHLSSASFDCSFFSVPRFILRPINDELMRAGLFCGNNWRLQGNSGPSLRWVIFLCYPENKQRFIFRSGKKPNPENKPQHRHEEYCEKIAFVEVL